MVKLYYLGYGFKLWIRIYYFNVVSLNYDIWFNGRVWKYELVCF